MRIRPAQLFWYILLSALVLAATVRWFTDFGVQNWGSLLLAVVLIQIFQVCMQPVFGLIARALGLAGVALIGLFGSAIIFWVVFSIIPGTENVTFLSSFWAAWVYAIFVVVIQWVFVAQSDDAFLRETLRTRDKQQTVKSDKPGFVFVQLDGVSSEVLSWQLKTGNLPNLQRLMRDEGYKFESWKTQIPSTTPASQAGILFGRNDEIPAFRWYDRKQQKLIVANQVSGAQLIEQRLSTGKGLLADEGVAIGTLFSGDAAQSIMVLSKLDDKKSFGIIQQYTRYFSSAYGFMRAIVLTIAEMVKELRQAQRQRRHDIQPRIDREFTYVLLRAATNVLMRDLQTRLVLQKMLSGTNSIYVNYVDYDEIAHHAGPARPESLDSLSGLDRVIGILFKAKIHTPRPYHIILLSDHGQSQGSTFRQMHDGKSLEDQLGELLKTDKIIAGTDAAESATEAQPLPTFKKQHQVKSRISKNDHVIVTGSGNMGNVWFTRYKTRASLEQITKYYPKLVEKLLATKGIGCLVINSEKAGPICLGKGARLVLKDGKFTGKNPLEAYTGIRPEDILRPALMQAAPDIQIYSSFDSHTDEVHAFEELVGNHGGIGGWQTDAILLHPGELKIAKRHYVNGTIYDSTTIHKILIDWLTRAGQR